MKKHELLENSNASECLTDFFYQATLFFKIPYYNGAMPWP
jgi:hypothetical protein